MKKELEGNSVTIYKYLARTKHQILKGSFTRKPPRPTPTNHAPPNYSATVSLLPSETEDKYLGKIVAKHFQSKQLLRTSSKAAYLATMKFKM